MKDISNSRNKSYYDIVADIVKNDEIQKLKYIRHHGLNRYEHNKRVSYYSYLICKFLHLDYESAARAGMVHDFFFDASNEITIKERFKVLETHPKKSLKNAKKYFVLSKKEENIILSHMFPVVPTVFPKYIESWVVDLVDDWVGVGERIYATRTGIVKFANIFILICLYK